MIAAARMAGVSLMVSHNQRYFGHHARARELLDAGAIGDPFMVVASVHVHGQIGGFRRFLEKAGGGTMITSRTETGRFFRRGCMTC
jgi:predicted dehydrogenase